MLKPTNLDNPDALVQSWLSGRAQCDGQRLTLQPLQPTDLAHKCRLAYHWLVTQAIFCPYTDLEYGDPLTLGAEPAPTLNLPSQPSYASFVLLPLLTVMTSRSLLFIGAPGRGKTTLATLMGLLAGHSLREMRHAIQHGHPQLNQTDLLGSPLPADLIKAQQPSDIRVAWRGWLSLRVKIIDEYNRIPTKTQAALLSLMAEGYAEMYEQIIECGDSAWFLTANDELGGGTFPVIDALKDRIDLVVRGMPFHSLYLQQLAQRLENAQHPENFIPQALIFSPGELQQINAQIRAIPLAAPALDRLGFFLSQLDFCQRASTHLEFQNKDTLHLAGLRVGQVCTEDCPLDKQQNICSQTENGVSARAYQTIIHYAKALAFFRGQAEAGDEDIRQIVPWVLHERLQRNPHSPIFQSPRHHHYKTDTIAWIRQLYDQAMLQFVEYQGTHQAVHSLQQQATSDFKRTQPLSDWELQQRLQKLQTHLQQLLQQEFNAPVHHDLVLLKHLYSQYRPISPQRPL